MRVQLNQRVSFFVVILIAFSVLVAIRFSGYILPSKYYFSISSVFKSDESLMLVSHPGVTGKRFCELMRQHKVTVDDLGISQFDCSADNAQKPFDFGQERLKERHRDKIYNVWINSRDQIASDISASLDRQALGFELLQAMSSVSVYEKEKIRFGGAYSNALEGTFKRAIGTAIDGALLPHFQKVTEEIDAEFNQPFEQGSQYGDAAYVSDEEFARLRAKVTQAVGTHIVTAISNDKPIEIDFSDMRSSMESVEYRWGINTGIREAYAKKIMGSYQSEVDRILAEEGLRAADIDNAIASVHKAFLMENLPVYTISAIIRFAVVFAAVFLIAFATFGKLEVQNYSFGAAMAAILLTWPVISLWDWVVREDWQAMKFTFLAIYFLYAVAFFFTGKAAGLCAFLARNRLADSGYGQKLNIATDGTQVVFQTTMKEMLNSCLIAGTTSAFVYALNIIVPVNV